MRVVLPIFRRLLPKALLLGLMAGLVACGARSTDDAEGARQTWVVQPGVFRELLSVSGVLQPALQVDVGSQVSGQIKKLHVQLGDRVSQGQLLAEIDPSLAQADVESARAAHDSLIAQKKVREIQRAQTRAEFKRLAALEQRGLVAQKDYEAIQFALAQQQAELQGLYAQIRQSQSQLGKTSRALAFSRITAPVDGVVVAVLATEGQTLIAQQQAPVILKLAHLATMTGKLRIPEADIHRVKAGMSLDYALVGRPKKVHAGVLKSVVAVPEKINGVTFYTGLVEVSNPDGEFLPDMTIIARVTVGEMADVLAVPEAALHKSAKGQDHVWLVQQGKTEARNVQLGLRQAGSAVVTQGLKAGDEILVDRGPAP